MKKRFLPLFFLLILCAGMLCPVLTCAAAPLNPDADASLTLHYRKDGTAFPDLNIAIYRVAEACPDGSFMLVEPYASYPVNIHGITEQEQWNRTAETLTSCLVADQVTPDREATTDAEGTAVFEQLETGLYLVREVLAEDDSGTYLFNRFMIYVPTPQPDGTFDYAVEANPKCVQFVPKTQYTVTKLWQDAGNQTARPKEVTVELYRDGVLQETKKLNAANNWTYTWLVSGEEQGIWTVAENPVPKSYRVSVQQNGSVFSVINTAQTKPDTPQTGDTFAPLPWILAMCISGIGLLLLGVPARRRR